MDDQKCELCTSYVQMAKMTWVSTSIFHHLLQPKYFGRHILGLLHQIKQIRGNKHSDETIVQLQLKVAELETKLTDLTLKYNELVLLR